MEASYRLKQAQHFSTCRKVLDGNSRVRQDLPDSRGMGIADRSIRCLPSHPHPSSLKEMPKILPQVSGVPVHLPTFRTGQKEVKLMALSRSQTPPIPGRLADQVSVTGGSPSEHSGSGRSNPVLGMDHQLMKSTESHLGFFICGLRVPPGFSPCKTHSNEGWGAHLEPSSTQGLWSPQEKGLHINVLELKAAFLALKRFKDQFQDQTMLVATDNSTVVAYINNKEEHTQQRCVHSCGES